MHTSSSFRRCRLSALLGPLLWWAHATVAAQVLPPDDPPYVIRLPPLMAWATDTPQRFSGANAGSSFYGSQRSQDCTSSYAFWECRSGVNDSDGVNVTRTDGELVRAERDASAFGPRMDITPATAWAQARTDFGANLGSALASGSRSFLETRVQGAWDGTVSSEQGFTRAGASALSLYTETLVPDLDGPIVLEFELRQHPGSSWAFSGSTPPYTLYGEDSRGGLQVVVYNLDEIVDYWLIDRNDPIPGPALVANERVSRDGDEGSGSSFLVLAFDGVAGTRYSLVSQLMVGADDNGSANFYGTASLSRILVAPGVTLQVGSGTAYAITAVPEPGSWLLLAGGLAGLVLRARLVRC